MGNAAEALAWLASGENRDEELRGKAKDILNTLIYLQMTDKATMVATGTKAEERKRTADAPRVSPATPIRPERQANSVYSVDGPERRATI